MSLIKDVNETINELRHNGDMEMPPHLRPYEREILEVALLIVLENRDLGIDLSFVDHLRRSSTNRRVDYMREVAARLAAIEALAE